MVGLLNLRTIEGKIATLGTISFVELFSYILILTAILAKMLL